MQPNHTIEGRLNAAPVPTLLPGHHRETLAQQLLTQRAAGSAIKPVRIWLPTAIAAILLISAALPTIYIATRPGTHPVRMAVGPQSAPATTNATNPSRRVLNETVEGAQAPGARILSLRRKSLEQSVAEAQVILVGDAVDFSPAPPHVKGDAPEHFIRFKIQRVIKGKLEGQFVTTRTPTNPAEFVGHRWVVMLSPENIAGKHQYAGIYTEKLEDNIKAIIVRQQK